MHWNYAFQEETNLSCPLFMGTEGICIGSPWIALEMWKTRKGKSPFTNSTVCVYDYIIVIFSYLFPILPSFSSRIFRGKSVSSCMTIFHRIVWKIGYSSIVHTDWYRALVLKPCLSSFLCWLRLTHILDIVLAKANVQFPRDYFAVICWNCISMPVTVIYLKICLFII